jgi:hypothetical protein
MRKHARLSGRMPPTCPGCRRRTGPSAESSLPAAAMPKTPEASSADGHCLPYASFTPFPGCGTAIRRGAMLGLAVRRCCATGGARVGRGLSGSPPRAQCEGESHGQHRAFSQYRVSVTGGCAPGPEHAQDCADSLPACSRPDDGLCPNANSAESGVPGCCCSFIAERRFSAVEVGCWPWLYRPDGGLVVGVYGRGRLSRVSCRACGGQVHRSRTAASARHRCC